MNNKPIVPGEEHPLPGDVRELFRSYRDSFDGIDGSVNFMPGLWARIDSRRRVTYSFGRFASAFVTAAFLICLILSGTLLTTSQPSNGYQSTYIDVLADNATADDELEIQLASAETP
jgi:hypothetical protein